VPLGITIISSVINVENQWPHFTRLEIGLLLVERSPDTARALAIEGVEFLHVGSISESNLKVTLPKRAGRHSRRSVCDTNEKEATSFLQAWAVRYQISQRSSSGVLSQDTTTDRISSGSSANDIYTELVLLSLQVQGCRVNMETVNKRKELTAGGRAVDLHVTIHPGLKGGDSETLLSAR